MAQQKLKFTIRQDGTVTEEVIGIVGDSCQELTKQIEEALGEVSYKEKKPERTQIPNPLLSSPTEQSL